MKWLEMSIRLQTSKHKLGDPGVACARCETKFQESPPNEISKQGTSVKCHWQYLLENWPEV